MPEYIVFVMPPEGEDAEPFDIPEWEFDARRSYRGAPGA